MIYLWIKAFHIFAMVCWFAGIFYLPRLFVYHAMATDPGQRATFEVMESKLYRVIMTPTAILTIVLGACLLWLNPQLLQLAWLQIKLGLIVILVLYHLYCGRVIMLFKKNAIDRSHVYFRWFNEFPILILLPVVLLAVLKPN